MNTDHNHNQKCKIVLAVLADLSGGSEESLGRVANAFVAAYDLKKNTKKEFIIVFLGAGTRSIKALEDINHPLNRLYNGVKDKIAGASHACSQLFKADIGSIPTLKDCSVDGLGHTASLAKYWETGYCVVTF